MTYTSTEVKKAKDLRTLVNKWGITQPKGTLKDYIVCYRDWCRGNGDYTLSHQTKLYKKHSGEYCVLQEVLNAYYIDHIKR